MLSQTFLLFLLYQIPDTAAQTYSPNTVYQLVDGSLTNVCPCVINTAAGLTPLTNGQEIVVGNNPLVNNQPSSNGQVVSAQNSGQGAGTGSGNTGSGGQGAGTASAVAIQGQHRLVMQSTCKSTLQ